MFVDVPHTYTQHIETVMRYTVLEYFIKNEYGKSMALVSFGRILNVC